MLYRLLLFAIPFVYGNGNRPGDSVHSPDRFQLNDTRSPVPLDELPSGISAAVLAEILDLQPPCPYYKMRICPQQSHRRHEQRRNSHGFGSDENVPMTPLRKCLLNCFVDIVHINRCVRFVELSIPNEAHRRCVRQCLQEHRGFELYEALCD